MRYRCFVFVLLLAALTARADIRGVYVYTGLETPFNAAAAQSFKSALAVPGVDGMLLVGLWSTIEPSMGQYQWNALDQWIAFAMANGKDVTLVIRAGDGIPSWLFQAAPSGAGATPLNFTISPHEGKTNICVSETLPAPWDPAFLHRWDTLLSAIAAHLKSNGTYNAVTTLRLTGINRTSDELRLPAETAQSTGLPCVSDSLATWQAAGYRPSKLVAAWDAITTSFQKAFPDKFFSVAIITNPPQLAFPTIDENGALMTGTIPDQNAQLLPLAAQKLAGRLVVQFNFLLPGTPANPFVVAAAQNLGTMAAFQTNNFYSLTNQGAACGGSPDAPTPCTEALYLQMLQTGIDPLGPSNPLRAQYLELWSANVNAFPNAVYQSHLDLRPPAERRRATRH